MTAKACAGIFFGALIALAAQFSSAADSGKGGSAAKLNSDSRAALSKLYAGAPAAKALGEKAVAILVFPSITKAGFNWAELKAKGVVFEEYDYPNLKTVDSIATRGEVRSAWFRDSEGNILAVVQFPPT